ncbi:hypothetical protein [Limisalsivibrio acetivorans]|uniref:hypothetical protein n=1 Tax=Limisalsivibrio acetivorans TaxID=1304888 RepID=UPI0003B55BBA|nr:hypothetical protein [Limisalsivibrio acetivorans]
MNEDRSLKYEDFYNISIKNFYEIVTEIMHDFHFAFHRGIQDENRRRLEIWRASRDDTDDALVWIEIVKEDEAIDKYIGTDVLRTMNDENVTKLFFFTNGSLSIDEKDILDGRDHYIFTPTDIMETVSALDMKKASRFKKKRKSKSVPSGYMMIKNYLKGKEERKASVFVKTSTIPALVDKYTGMVRKTLDDIDKIEDIDNITPDIKERFKNVQHDYLPESIKVSSYRFIDHFSEVRERLFSVMQYLVMYIGAVIEFESEDDMKRFRDQVDEDLRRLQELKDDVDVFKHEQMSKSQTLAWRLIGISVIISGIAMGVLLFSLTRN